MARTVIGGIEFAETRYFPRDEVRTGRVDWIYGEDAPDSGLVPLTLMPSTEEDFNNGYDEVLVANYRALEEDFGIYGEAEEGQLVQAWFGMSAGLAYVGRDDTTYLGEIARQLAHEYPLYSEEAHSDLSWERQREYLKDGAVWDFRRDTGAYEDVADDSIVMALTEAIMYSDDYGSWDGSGYVSWDAIVATARETLDR